MISILIVVILVSCWCNGLFIITGKDMLFHFIDRLFWREIIHRELKEIDGVTKPVEEIEYQLRVSKLIYEPIIGCCPCMASFHGIIWALILMPFALSLLWQIPLICVCSSALNLILNKIYA